MAKAKPKAATVTAGIRKSTRKRTAPQRLTPDSDLPSEIQAMIHEAATSTAAKSDVPFAPEAVTMLERALEPIFRNMMEAAMQNAVLNGRDSINEADLEVVRKRIKKR